jgi:HK97 family phage portal protein
MDKIIDIKTRKPKIIDPSTMKGFNFESEFEDGTGLWDAEYQATMDMLALKGLFFNEPWPYIALDLVADSLSQVPMVVKRLSTDASGDVNEETVTDHPALMILQNPNPFQGYKDFIYNLEVEIDLMGNGIIYYAKRSNQLWIIPAETVTLDLNEGRLAGYRVHQDLGQGQIDATSAEVFKPDDIWHYRRPNPRSLLWGLSPFVPNRKPVLLNRYSLDWVMSFYLKGATPNVIIQSEKPNVDEKRALRMLKTFEQAHTGRANMRRPLLVPNGYKAEMMNQSIADQNFVELVKLNREDILQILRIPKHAVGLAESGSLGSKEHEMALRFFFTDSIQPRQAKIEEFLTDCFRSQLLLEENEVLEFDNSEVAILQEDRQAQAELAQSLMPIWSLNEIRSEIFNKDPLPEGEAVASAVPVPTPVSTAVDDDEQEVEEVEEVSDTTLEEDDDETQDKDYRDSINKKLINKFGDAIVKGLEDQVSLLEQESKQIEPYVHGLLDKWIEEALPVVLRELKKGQPKEKAVGNDETPKKIPSKKRLRRLLAKVFGKDEDEYLTTTLAEMEAIPSQAFDTTVVTVLNQENVAELEALKRQAGEKTRKLMQARGLETFHNISETTTNKIFTIIENGIKDGKGLRDIGIDIAASTQLTQGRATTIARTEALTANSLGQKAAMDAAEEVVDDLVKIWVNADDLRVRGRPGGLYPDAKDDHWKLGGEVRDVKDVYSNGLDYPRDPKGKAFQTINCRCTQVIASRKDLTDEDFQDFKNPT